jgi:putative ABC transport system ATP-binding protein
LLIDSNQRLNQTILIITHDERIAMLAKRILALKDGKIVRDERVRK